MTEFTIDIVPPAVYNALDGYGDSALDFVDSVETKITELQIMLRCCDWTPDERRDLKREMAELELTRYEIKILGAM